MADKPALLPLQLQDTLTKAVYTVRRFPANIVSSRSAGDSGDGDRTGVGVEVCVVPSGSSGEEYHVLLEDGGALRLVLGSCAVDGVPVTAISSPKLAPGSFLTLGSGRSLLYLLPGGVTSPAPRRKLPPTPGRSVQNLPPAKPQRQRQSSHNQTPPPQDTPAEDPGLRPRLQRISAEVTARLKGYEDRKPPPPYEQVGNSIGYQILHQQRHSSISSQLIDALYPALKENLIKDNGLEGTYTSYLTAYQQALGQSATPQCLLPADTPTIDFIMELLLHICCMPHMTVVVEKQGKVWMKALAVLVVSPQNSTHMTRKGHASKVLSCMHLSVMANQIEFQQHGWAILTHMLAMATPTAPGEKPVLSEASLMLALCLAQSQLDQHNQLLPLMTANLRFLAQVASIAKSATTTSKPHPYTPHQAHQVLALFQERSILRHVMKIPAKLRSEAEFQSCYNTLVKSLVPTRGQGRALFRNTSRTSLQPTSDALSTQQVLLGNRESGPCRDLQSSSSPKLGSCSDLTFVPVSKAIGKTTGRSSSCSNLLEGVSCHYGNSTDDLTVADQFQDNGNQPIREIGVASPRKKELDEDFPELESNIKSEAVTLPETNGLVVSLPETNGLMVSLPETNGLLVQETTETKTNKIKENKTKGLDISADTEAKGLNIPDGMETEGLENIPTKELETQDKAKEIETETEGLRTLSESRRLDNIDNKKTELESSVKGMSDSLPVSLPISPSTAQMTEDVKDLLELLRAPLDPSPPGPGDGIVRIPSLSRNNRYYRHSLKHKESKDCHGNDQHHGNQRSFQMEEHTKEELQELPWQHREQKELPRQLLNELEEEQLEGKTSQPEQELLRDQKSSPASRCQGTGTVEWDQEPLQNGMAGIQVQPQMSGTEEECEVVTPLSPGRGQWRTAVTHQTYHSNDSSMFEVSGQYLSLSHSVLEDVRTLHTHLNTSLNNRHQLVQGILSLWSCGKGLQAATNLLQACFSKEEENDVTLFVDTLPCFMAYSPPWTLAVCVVLLPPLHQLLAVHCLQRHVKVLCDVVLMIVDKFADKIVAWQGSKFTKKRSSSRAERDQEIICYKELHALRCSIHRRLDNNHTLPTELGDQLRQLHTALRPFKK